MNLMVIAMACLAQVPTTETPTYTPQRFVEAARSLKGVPYEFGGRMRKPGEGIDCQGVLFYAAERVGRCGWKSFSVFPTKAVESAELGARVVGLDPVATADLNISALQPGDIIMFVDYPENPAEAAIGALNARPVWVWHTGLYAGDGKFVVGDHFAGEVVELDLQNYLREHYAGVFITRMQTGPRAQRCKTHAPMKR